MWWRVLLEEGDDQLHSHNLVCSRVAMSSAQSAVWLKDVSVDDVIANSLIRTRIRISSCAIDQWHGGVFKIMLRRIQGRPRWSRAAGPEGNTGERCASFFRFRERVGIHTSAQHVTTSSSLEERGMRNHTMCCRLSYIIRSRMPRMCDDGCIGRGPELRQLAPLRTLGVRMHYRGTATVTGVCGREAWGWLGWLLVDLAGYSIHFRMADHNMMEMNVVDLCQRGEIFGLWSGTWRGWFYNMGLTQFAIGCVWRCV